MNKTDKRIDLTSFVLICMFILFVTLGISFSGVLECSDTDPGDDCDTGISARCKTSGGSVNGCWLLCPEPDPLVWCKYEGK